MTNAVAFCCQLLHDVGIEQERNDIRKQNPGECGLIRSPNAVRSKKEPSNDHRPTSLVGIVSALKSAPRQVHGHRFPSNALSRCHSKPSHAFSQNRDKTGQS